MVKQAKATQKSINISKGIVFTFLTIYLVIFGMLISDFVIHIQEENPSNLPVWWGILSYLPLLCYFGAIFSGAFLIIFLRNATTTKVRQTQSRKKIKSGSIYKQALFVIIFIFAFIPLLSPIVDQGINTQNFSVYNSAWNGASDFKQIIEDEEYEVRTIQSSLSATERLDKSILLILLGPNQYYDPIFEIPFFINFFNSSNSLLICHDHGSTSTLLWEIMLAGAFAGLQVPITIFPNGVLRDNLSYYPTPEFPIITNFATDHPTTRDVDNVILSVSSCAAGGPFLSFFGWEPIGSTTKYSFIDKDDNGRYTEPEDALNLGFMSLITSFAGFEDFPLEYIPLGVYSQSVFMAKENGPQRLFVSADASLFNNELIDDPEYDNMQFGINIINWLTHQDEGQSKEDWVVVFDEAHIRPEYSRDLTSAGIFGYVMQYIVHLSTNPITAWIYPLLAFYSLRKYLPKKDKKKEEQKIAAEEEKKEEVARFRTSSFFAQKIDEYKDKMKYGDALKLLYRRLERKLHTQLGGAKITTENVVDLVVSKDPSTTKLKTRRLTKFMDKIIAIKEGKQKVKTEQDFEELFFEMDWAVKNI